MTHISHKPLFLRRLTALAGAMAFASVLPAQTAGWLPLEIGNTWLYRPAATSSTRPGAGDYRTISVHGSETVSGRDYFDVTWFGREVILRVEPSNGSVILYDKAAGLEQPWISPGLPVGATFPTQINPCPTTGEIAARDASVTTPAGQFSNAVH